MWPRAGSGVNPAAGSTSTRGSSREGAFCHRLLPIGLSVWLVRMEEAEKELASRCYGYGRWDAPYWFIGPEQGQARWENDDLSARFEAFRKLSKDGLSDCRSFHNEIHETRWHRENPPAALQPTWKFLILALKAFLQESIEEEGRRRYQRHCWGSSEGETCVIELSGLPATNFNVPRRREVLRQERLEFIHSKMTSFHPRFVIIYGRAQVPYWKGFWQQNAVVVANSGEIARLPYTTVAFAPHPTAPWRASQYRSANQYWFSLGQKLRQSVTSVECAAGPLA